MLKYYDFNTEILKGLGTEDLLICENRAKNYIQQFENGEITFNDDTYASKKHAEYVEEKINTILIESGYREPSELDLLFF